MEWDKIWSTNAKIIDPIAKRFNSIDANTASVIHILNHSGVVEGKTTPWHPKQPELGNRVRLFTPDLYVESQDLEELKTGDKFTLRELGNVRIVSLTKKDNNSFECAVNMDPNDKDFKDTRKVCWVPC